MANQSLYDAFERVHEHITLDLAEKLDKVSLSGGTQGQVLSKSNETETGFEWKEVEKSRSIELNVPATGWVEGAQTLAIEGLTANTNGIFNLAGNVTTEQYEAAADAGIIVAAQTEGSITLAAKGNVPTIDIPAVLIIMP